MRLIAILLAASVLAPLVQAQVSSGTIDAPVGDPVRTSGMKLVAHLPSGATTTVRYSDEGWFVFRDGASVVLAEIAWSVGGDPEIHILDRMTFPTRLNDLAVAGQRVYAATGYPGGLQILSVGAEMQLEELAKIEGFDAFALAARGDNVYVDAGQEGVRIYWIVHPVSPQFTATLSTGGVGARLFVDGDLLYVANRHADDYGSLQVFDVADVYDPLLLTTYDTPAYATAVVAAGQVAFVSGAFGVLALDLADMAQPVLLDHLDTAGPAQDIEAAGQRLVVVSTAGLSHIDASDPGNLQIIGLLEIDGEPLRVAVEPGYGANPRLLLADRLEGLRYVMLPPAGDPFELAFYRNSGYSHKVAFDGDYVYVTELGGSLRIVDVSDLDNGATPVEVARIAVGALPQQVLADQGVAYVSHAHSNKRGVTIIDVSEASAPEIIGFWSSRADVFDLGKADDLLFLATADGVVALDVEDPAAPVPVGTFPTEAPVTGLALRDGLAVVTTSGAGMLTLDVAVPDDMVLIAHRPEWPLLSAVDFTYLEPAYGWLFDDYAFIGDSIEGLRAVDLSDPAYPVSVSPVQAPGPIHGISRGFGFIGNVAEVAYVAVDSYGLFVWWDGNWLDTFRTADSAVGVAARSAYWTSQVVLASGEAGVYFLIGPVWISTEDPPAAYTDLDVLPPYPNPARSQTHVAFVLSSPASVTIEVFDLLGRRTAAIYQEVLPAGQHEMPVDLSAFAAGTYLVRITTGAGAGASRKLTILQ